jgi:hypothetical protein
VALTGDERDTFTGRFYKACFGPPYVFIHPRYAIDPRPHRVEFFASVRMEWHQPGDFTSREPYPDSLCAAVFPDGERGFLSILQASVMVENRDNEPASSRSYWFKGSLRGAAPYWGSGWSYWGSGWSYFGINTPLRGYLPLTQDGRVVGLHEWSRKDVSATRPFVSRPILVGLSCTRSMAH